MIDLIGFPIWNSSSDNFVYIPEYKFFPVLPVFIYPGSREVSLEKLFHMPFKLCAAEKKPGIDRYERAHVRETTEQLIPWKSSS